MKIFDIRDFIRVRLLEGAAEVYGRELPLDQIVYFYDGQNISIFTWYGAKIEIEDHTNYYRPGQDDGQRGTQMRELVNLNYILESERNASLH